MFVFEMVLIVVACVMGLAMLGTMVWMVKNSKSRRISKKQYNELLAKYGKQ